MLKKQEIIINQKISQFNEKNINVDFNDVLNFLENVYFKHEEKTEENLEKFLNEDNLEKIISFLMSDALMNPKY